MSYHRDEYFERFRELTAERGWTEDQTMFVGRIAAHGLLGFESVNRLVDQIFQIEDGLAAERGDAIIQYENVFNPAGIERANQGDYQKPTLSEEDLT